MVFLILLVCGCAPVLGVFAGLTGAGIASASTYLGTIDSRLNRFFAVVAIIVLVAAIAASLILLAQPLLPDFRTRGDGGVGMAFNLISKVAVWLLVPAITCFLTGLLLRKVGRDRSQADEV